MIKHISPKLRIILLLLICVAGVRFLLMPLYDWQEQTQTRISVLQKSILRLDGLEKNRQQLEATYNEVGERLKNMEEYFQADITTPESLQLKAQQILEQMVAESGISSQGMNWSYVNVGQLLIRTPLRITFQSTVDQFYDFMYRVETYPQLFTIDSLQVTKFKNDKVSGVMDITAYALNTAANKGK